MMGRSPNARFAATSRWSVADVRAMTTKWIVIDGRKRKVVTRGRVDGRAVDQAVRELVSPALKDVGFHRFTGHSAWRQHGQTVDLVVFRSFTSYIAFAVLTPLDFTISGADVTADVGAGLLGSPSSFSWGAVTFYWSSPPGATAGGHFVDFLQPFFNPFPA